MKNPNGNGHKINLTIYVNEDLEKLVNIFSETFETSKLEISSLFFISGVDLVLAQANRSLSNLNIETLRRDTSRWVLKEKINEVIVYHKKEKEVKKE